MKISDVQNGMVVEAIDAQFCGYCTVGETYVVNVRIDNKGKIKGQVWLRGARGQTFSNLKFFLRGFKPKQ